ncbi:DMT family transporter [Gordonia sp. SL306]|uniref:DMT family transporter n=1 Tax=Gordonia sp. SL306 TaxID=2995145 RepID=UPI0022708B23|nr:DMT family transporter [Gordonia sp. SL306]WAC56680.1 DMT family transporter [Gordonia sp. SL306]
MHSWVPALLSILAAVLIAGGTVMRQRASHASGAIGRGWWIGATVALCGFAAQVAALGLGSILLVQPLVVLAILFALPMEAWADHRWPLKPEWTWGAVLVICVTVFLAISRPEPSLRRPGGLLMVVTISAVIIVLVGCVLAAERSNQHYKALLYGVTAGALFGMSALLVKTIAYQFIHDFAGAFLQPEFYMFLVVAAGGVVAQQRAFGAGELQTSFPALTVIELAVSMGLGVVLLGENLNVSVPTALFLGVVLALMVRAVLELAKLAAVRADEANCRTRNAAPDEVVVP